VVVAVLLTGFLAAWNNVANRFDTFRRHYVAINLLVTGLLLALAREQGWSWEELGLAVTTVPAGLAWGAVGTLAVVLALGLALAMPALRTHLRDPRVRDLSPAGLAWHTLLRIPLGTVLLEEVAFRGVLLVAWQQVQPLAVAVAISSVVFGVWHVLPTVITVKERGSERTGLPVALGVLVTALAGVAFCGLRIVSGSVVAPLVVHLATNSLGALAAWLAQNQKRYRQVGEGIGER
jgi:CAAX protease family protein